MHDNENRPVYILIGRAWRDRDYPAEGFHALLTAPDDDSAVRSTLEALAREGYEHAELDRIGELEGPPGEEPHLSAWQGALEGDISIVTFQDPFGD
jgi:hypothetical protein